MTAETNNVLENCLPDCVSQQLVATLFVIQKVAFTLHDGWSRDVQPAISESDHYSVSIYEACYRDKCVENIGKLYRLQGAYRDIYLPICLIIYDIHGFDLVNGCCIIWYSPASVRGKL